MVQVYQISSDVVPKSSFVQNAKTFSKAYRVIMSCKTEEQAKVAYKFMELAKKRLTEKQLTVLHESYVTIALQVTGVI